MDATRRVTVIGRGEATAEPDVVGVRLGVRTDASTAREALAENNAQMRSLVARLRELGVAEGDVRTSYVGIWPQHDYGGRRARGGYHAGNSLTVVIRDADRTGEMLDKIVDAGANEVSGISPGIEDTAPLEETALSRAIANARERAELAARAAGAMLGPVLEITEEIGASPYPEDRGIASFAAAASEGVPFHPNQEKVQARVRVTFELKTDGEAAT